MKFLTNTSKKLTTLIILVFNVLIHAQHESLLKVKLSDQVSQSNQIVEGKVISKSSFWDEAHQFIYTKQIIEVYKVFKGEEVETIELITKGGIVGYDAIIVSHSLQLNEGDAGVFILDEIINSKNISIGSASKLFTSKFESQGFYKYNIRKNIASNGTEIFEDIPNNFYKSLENQTQKSAVIIKNNNLNLNSTLSGKVIQNNLVTNTTATMSSFNGKSYSAGTKSILTINGTGFGDTKGSVSFSDADFGGYFYSEALSSEILSWTDTKIEVEIPDTAGTGYVKVNTMDNGTVTSSEKLIVDYAEINLDYNGNSYQTQHVDKNGNGGYTWQMNQEFYESDANQAFTRALNTWKCGTGINWDISAELTSVTKYNSYDNVNSIIFSDDLGGTVLGQCYSRYAGCAEGSKIVWYVVELDIVFNRSINWNYSTSPPESNQIDFESVTVHELGHGHQLGHVVNSNYIMNYSLSTGKYLRSLTAVDLEGGQDVQSRSTSSEICGELSMVSASCSTLSNDEFELSSQFNIYPNPVESTLFIQNNENLNVHQITMHNIQGSVVFNQSLKNWNRTTEINVSHLTSGIYLLSIDTVHGTVRKKVLIK
ncbi:T9SS type A sorting domain-containing protein [Aestuariibaculum sediminum]|uniref:T9SS type A sorting domain-containing protein n=1 Tax=Aestuariibaculum sediminum TaxID=2770637 RepID=A0A8J6QAJ4_9FLAO|nr:T9SS type A sorting domain-containing protein [Aestuariibaculum sediminum]MBD0832011.1 T9SS type A sorting domain-containing protein [Aestuariibaculum sediminum]